MLWSCQEKEGLEGAVSGKVELAGSVTDGQILVDSEGGDFQVDVTSSGDWRVSGLADWVILSAESGKSGQPLTFTVLPNDDVKSRTVTFKVFSADAVQPVTIIQSPTYQITLLTEDSVSFNSDANKLYVKLDSNVEEFEYDFGGADWISFDKVEDVFGKKVISFDINRSQDFSARETALTLTNNVSDDEVVINVSQAQRDTAFVVGEQRIIKGLEAISVDLVIKSNVDITYSVPSWLKQTVGESVDSDENGLNKISTSTRTGYYLRKLLRDDCDPNPSATNAQYHYPVYLRYTEIFLAYAEAANEAWGPTGKGSHGFSAYDVIKALHDRAGVGNDYLDSIQGDKDKMRELIRNERRIELSFENKRFWDMRRWNLDLNETAKGIKIDQVGGALQYTKIDVEPRNYASHMYHGPIPETEVLKWSNLEQNKGW